MQDTETGEQLIGIGLAVNIPGIINAGLRAVRNFVPELFSMILGGGGQQQPPPDAPPAASGT